MTVYSNIDTDRLRLKWEDILTGTASVRVDDPDIAARIREIETAASMYWNTMNTSGGNDVLWDPDPGSGISVFDKMRAMALAYNTRGSYFEGNRELCAAIIFGLEWAYTNLYNESCEPASFISQEIVIPKRMNDTVVLLFDELTVSQKTRYMRAIERFTPTIDRLDGATETGANRVSKATAVAISGAIAGKPERVSIARNSLDELFHHVSSGDGMYSDGSFLFHGNHPYNGGYGMSLLAGLADLMLLFRGTPWEFDRSKTLVLTEWVRAAYLPLIWKGRMMDMVRGRCTAFYDKTAIQAGATTLIAIVSIAEVASDDTELKCLVQRAIADSDFGELQKRCTLAQLARLKRVKESATISTGDRHIECRQFHHMDRTIHRRKDFAFGISMHSNRVYNFENIFDQNRRGWHTGDGMTYLYTEDVDQFADGYWPTVNAHRLPGTTVAAGSIAEHRNLSTQAWAGGVQLLNRYGVSGMIHEPRDHRFVAKKLWFLFDDIIVASGCVRSGFGKSSAETIIENRKLSESTAGNLTVDGKQHPDGSGVLSNVSWIHLAPKAGGRGIGYYFPEPTTVNALREERTGCWEDINAVRFIDESFVRSYQLLWVNHEPSPAASRYAYAILPTVTPERIARYSENSDVTVVVNTEAVQAVGHRDLRILGANFGTDTYNSAGPIASTGPASIAAKISDVDVLIAVADPTHEAGTVEIEIDLDAHSVTGADTRIEVLRIRPTIRLSIDFAGTSGESLEARFLRGVSPSAFPLWS